MFCIAGFTAKTFLRFATPQFSRTDRVPSMVSPSRAVKPIPIPPQNTKKFSLLSIAVDGCVALQMNQTARAKVMKPNITANTQKIRRPKWAGIIDADATTGYSRMVGYAYMTTPPNETSALQVIREYWPETPYFSVSFQDRCISFCVMRSLESKRTTTGSTSSDFDSSQ